MAVENEDTTGQDQSQSGEGTVDWEAAEEFLSGESSDDESSDQEGSEDGDDAGETGEDTQDGIVEVRVKGRTIRMSAEDARAFEEYRREQRERDGRLGGQISQYQERLARLEAIQEERDRVARETFRDEPSMPEPELALRNFPQWQEKMAEYNSYQQAKLMRSLEDKFTNEREAERRAIAVTQRNQAWAASFYNANPHLNKPVLKPVVAAVFTENQRELESYGNDYASAFQRLAELTDLRVNEIMSIGKTTTKKAPTLESSQVRTPAKPAPAGDKQFSVSDWADKKRKQFGGRE